MNLKAMLEIQQEFDKAKGFYMDFAGKERLLYVAIVKELGELINELWKVYRLMYWKKMPKEEAWQIYCLNILEEAADVAAYTLKALYHFFPSGELPQVQVVTAEFPEDEERLLLTLSEYSRKLWPFSKEKYLKLVELLSCLDLLCKKCNSNLEEAYREKMEKNWRRF